MGKKAKSNQRNHQSGERESRPSTMTIRFNKRDADLQEWLGQFAASYDMSKVVKLACYLLSGLQPDEGLLALLPNIQVKQVEPVPVQPATEDREPTQDPLAAVMQELAAIRDAIAEQKNQNSSDSDEPVSDSRRRRKQQPRETSIHQPPGPEEYETRPPDVVYQESVPTASSGLDMSRPRKKAGAPKPVSHPTPTATVADAEEARRRLLESIYSYGKEFHRGH